MREIKFRAWVKNEYDGDDLVEYMEKDASCFVNPFEDHEDGEIILMQYTGLKDKNDVEIYEGDILKFEDCGEEGYEYKDGFDFTNMATVCFSDGRFELTNFQSDNSAVLEDMHGNDHETFILNFGLAEVIGNIYENPELLGVRP